LGEKGQFGEEGENWEEILLHEKRYQMAIIIPYADPNAHGSLGGAVSFRRRFGRVVFQKIPIPKNPNTPAQQAQRTAFKNASTDWLSYNAVSKGYYYTRAPELNWTARNLFLSAKLGNKMPDQTYINIREVSEGQILTPIGASSNEGYFSIAGRGTPNPIWHTFGYINDNENVWYSNGALATQHDAIRVRCYNPNQSIWRYGVWIKFRDWSDNWYEVVVRFRELPTYAINYYMSADGSTFYDIDLTELNATNNF